LGSALGIGDQPVRTIVQAGFTVDTEQNNAVLTYARRKIMSLIDSYLATV